MKIPEVDYYLEKLNYDKLTFNQIEYPTPFHILDSIKPQLDEYDYVVMCTNDVIIKQENMDTLISDLDSNPEVLSACFNVDVKENARKLNICFDMPQPYNWIDDTISGMHKVAFSGLPLMAIRTDIFRKYEWTGSTTSGDLRFCRWCAENNVDIVCNTDNRMLHLRYWGEKPVNAVQSWSWTRVL